MSIHIFKYLGGGRIEQLVIFGGAEKEPAAGLWAKAERQLNREGANIWTVSQSLEGNWAGKETNSWTVSQSREATEPRMSQQLDCKVGPRGQPGG